MNKDHNNILVVIPTGEEKTCQICKKEFNSKAAISGHIGAAHKIKFEDYLIKFYMNNVRPKCHICSMPTLYKRGTYSFKKYCPDHANEARIDWATNYGYGSLKGPKAGWKLGLTKETDVSIMKQSVSMGKEEKERKSKQPIKQTRIEKLKLTKEQYFNKETKFSKRFKLLTPYNEYTNLKQFLNVQCCSCGSIEKRTFKALLSYAVCKSCSPASVEEFSVREMIRTIEPNIICNDRKLIAPKEIDILLEKQNFAIEYNGLYWHSENRKGKDYHIDKTKACAEKGIQLFHIFSDEWRNKPHLIESMIKQRIGIVSNKYHARKTKPFLTKQKEAKVFFDECHISGHVNSSVIFGLYHQDNLIMALSLRTPFHKIYRDRKMIEIARMASAKDSLIVGGFSKLLSFAKKWSIQNGYKGILTYADLRFGKGEVYNKSGFTLVGKTKPDYWYSNGFLRFNRFGFKASDGKTEKQVAEEAGVFKVYGCGSNIYELTL